MQYLYRGVIFLILWEFFMDSDSSERNWYWEIVASCSVEGFDLVSFYLFEFGIDGIEELAQSEEHVTFKVFFPSEVDSPKKILILAAQKAGNLGHDLHIFSGDKRPLQNWQTNWQAHFKPIEIGRSFSVRPPWEPSRTDKKEIVIDPGLGFGTGYHESTRLALELMEWSGERCPFTDVVDVGTGSGILVIAALLLGAEKVTALDIDQEALKEVPKNLVLSGFRESACILLPQNPEELDFFADLVVANIEGQTLENLSKCLIRFTRPRGHLILSGILTELRSSLLNCFQPEMSILKEQQLGEWCSFVFQRPEDLSLHLRSC